MAALTLASGAVLALNSTGRADDRDKPSASKLKLELRVAGLKATGCEIEIKPGHPGCQFRTVSQHVDSRGMASILFDDVQTTSADRDCAFAITVREPGQPPRTFRRGLRLTASNGPIPTLTCYVSSPSRLARASEMRERR
jgi:hypothetical protein